MIFNYGALQLYSEVGIFEFLSKNFTWNAPQYFVSVKRCSHM